MNIKKIQNNQKNQKYIQKIQKNLYKNLKIHNKPKKIYIFFLMIKKSKNLQKSQKFT